MSTKIILALVNVFGGVAVLGSYAWCLANYPEHRDALWGGIQGSLRGTFTISMFLAAAGYLAFCYVNLFVGETMAFGQDSLIMGFNPIVILTVVFLSSSTLWMPSLIAYMRSGESAWWILCVTSLWITALSLSVMTGVAALSVAHGISQASKYAALAGLAYITFHSLFLDAIIWVTLFKK